MSMELLSGYRSGGPLLMKAASRCHQVPFTPSAPMSQSPKHRNIPVKQLCKLILCKAASMARHRDAAFKRAVQGWSDNVTVTAGSARKLGRLTSLLLEAGRPAEAVPLLRRNLAAIEAEQVPGPQYEASPEHY